MEKMQILYRYQYYIKIVTFKIIGIYSVCILSILMKQ